MIKLIIKFYKYIIKETGGDELMGAIVAIAILYTVYYFTLMSVSLLWFYVIQPLL